MNETITNEALDLIVFADDCKCESITHNNGRVTCSGDVAYRVVTDCDKASNGGRSILVCTNMGHSALSSISERVRVCQGCKRITGECWKVIPV